MGLIKLNNTGDQLIEEIFNDTIVVYEDIQGSKLIVRYDGSGFEFRPKSINSDPISMIDLSLQKYYNKAINFFYQLDDRVLSLLPKNWYFCFEYFPDNEPAHIEYKKTPKNSLILTGIIKGKKYNYSIEEIMEFSNLFNCDPLPIIFYGRLNDKQKKGIKSFLHTSENDLDFVFGNKNFAYFFYKLLDATHEHSFLMGENEFQPNIQRLIIRTNSNDYRYEILNPTYERNQELVKTDYAEIYSIILLEFLSYIQTIDIQTIKLSGNNFDKSYIYLISKLYNMYMNENNEELKDFDFNIPSFFNKNKFEINIDLIDNQLTKRYIKSNKHFEYIFKCILGSFRKKKSKTIGVFTERSVEIFNDYIDKINHLIMEHLNRMKEDKLRSNQLMDFSDYYNLNIETDGDGKVYPDVYSEFEPQSPTDKKKKGIKK